MCAVCMDLPCKPITTECGHNICKVRDFIICITKLIGEIGQVGLLCDEVTSILKVFSEQLVGASCFLRN